MRATFYMPIAPDQSPLIRLKGHVISMGRALDEWYAREKAPERQKCHAH